MENFSSDAPAQSTHLSKEAVAISALDTTPIASRPPRRTRRRRRSVRRRLFESILPFAVLVGLTVFAVGVVRIVEIGAAGQSKMRSVPLSEIARQTRQPAFNYELAQAEYEEMMRQHASGRNGNPKVQNQVGYQLSLQIEAQRDLSLAKGLPNSASSNDVMDWALFENSGRTPRSAPKGSVAGPSATSSPQR